MPTYLSDWLSTVTPAGSAGSSEVLIKTKLQTALDSVAVAAGETVWLDENGMACFNLDKPAFSSPRIKTRSVQRAGMFSPYRDWQGRDLPNAEALVAANRDDYYAYNHSDNSNIMQIRRWREYEFPEAAMSNQLQVYRVNSGDEHDYDFTEVSDDINSGDSTKWDAVFRITSPDGSVTSNITRTMDLHGEDIGDTVSFANYSHFFTNSIYPIFYVGSRAFIFAQFSYYSNTHTCYRARQTLIEFNKNDPGDGTIKYHDFLAPNDFDGDRVWAFYHRADQIGQAHVTAGLGYAPGDAFGNFTGTKDGGVFYDSANNTLYIKNVNFTGNSTSDNQNQTNATHWGSISVDLDTDTVLTTCMDEDMQTLRFMYNGVIQTCDVSSVVVNYEGYRGNTYRENGVEGVSVGIGDIIWDQEDDKEYMFFSGYYYQTGQDLVFPYGILEINTATTVATYLDGATPTSNSNMRTFVSAPDRSTAFAQTPGWDDTTNNTWEYVATSQGDEEAYAIQSVFKVDDCIVISSSTSDVGIPKREYFKNTVVFDTSDDTLYTAWVDTEDGLQRKTSSGSRAITETASTVAANVITYKWVEGSTTYEMPVTIDEMECWGETGLTYQDDATYGRIQFWSTANQYYITDGTYSYSPAVIGIQTDGTNAAAVDDKQQWGFVRYIEGNATSPVWLPMTQAFQSQNNVHWTDFLDTHMMVLATGKILVYATSHTDDFTYHYFHRNGEDHSGNPDALPYFQRNPMQSGYCHDVIQHGRDNVTFNQPTAKNIYGLAVFDFVADECYTSYPVMFEAIPQLVDGSGGSTGIDKWGKRLPCAPVYGNIFLVNQSWLSANRLTSGVEDQYDVWCITLGGPMWLYSDAANGQQRWATRGGYVVQADDDTYMYASLPTGTTMENTGSMKGKFVRIRKSDFLVEVYDSDTFNSSMIETSGAVSSHQRYWTTWNTKTYDTWTAGYYFGMENATGSLTEAEHWSIFHPFDGRFAWIKFYYNPRTYKDQYMDWEAPEGLLDVTTGKIRAITPNLNHIGNEVRQKGWNANAAPWLNGIYGTLVLPGDAGAEHWGWRWVDWARQCGTLPVTQCIGITLGPTVLGNGSDAQRLTPVALFNEGVDLTDNATDELLPHYVKPAGNTQGNKYYRLTNNCSGLTLFTGGDTNTDKVPINPEDIPNLPSQMQDLLQRVRAGQRIRHAETSYLSFNTGLQQSYTPNLQPLSLNNVIILQTGNNQQFYSASGGVFWRWEMDDHLSGYQWNIWHDHYQSNQFSPLYVEFE